MARSTHAELVARGCTCGDESYTPCPLHEPGDNRGLRAWFESGGLFRAAFPLENCTCGRCGSSGCLMYPSPAERTIHHPAVKTKRDLRSASGEPNLVCPTCSTRNAEAWLRYAAGLNGYELRPIGVFTIETGYRAEAA